MRTDVVIDIERTIENGLEDNGIKAVEIENNVIKVEMESGRAFARLFPKAEERIARKDGPYKFYVEGFDGDYVFFLGLYENEYEEFVKRFPVTETWGTEEEIEE